MIARINATVLGSKSAKDDVLGEEAQEAEDRTEAAAEEAGEQDPEQVSALEGEVAVEDSAEQS